MYLVRRLPLPLFIQTQGNRDGRLVFASIELFHECSDRIQIACSEALSNSDVDLVLTVQSSRLFQLVKRLID